MDKTVFGILTIILNCYGVPCFIQKQVKTGVLRIVLSCVTLGVIGCINIVFGIIDGIEILKMSDEEYKARFGTLTRGVPKLPGA